MWEKNQNSFALAVHIMVAFPKIYIFIHVCIQRNLVRHLLINNFSNSLTQIYPQVIHHQQFIFLSYLGLEDLHMLSILIRELMTFLKKH